MNYFNCFYSPPKMLIGGRIKKFEIPAGEIDLDKKKSIILAYRTSFPELADKTDDEIWEFRNKREPLVNAADGALSLTDADLFDDGPSAEELHNAQIFTKQLDGSEQSLATNMINDLDSDLEAAKDAGVDGEELQNLTDNTRDIQSKLKDKTKQKFDRASAYSGIGLAAINVFNLAGDAVLGDKNFGSQSAAVDSVVHGASSALMQSGNPFAMAAGAGLEVLNFSSKALGSTTLGFDVDINSSGYGNLGHMESKSNRDWGAMIGLGGLFGLAKLEKLLLDRNYKAQMALKAANISDDIKFEQESRMNSVDDVMRQNEIALAGGIDTSLLIN